MHAIESDKMSVYQGMGPETVFRSYSASRLGCCLLEVAGIETTDGLGRNMKVPSLGKRKAVLVNSSSFMITAWLHTLLWNQLQSPQLVSNPVPSKSCEHVQNLLATLQDVDSSEAI